MKKKIFAVLSAAIMAVTAAASVPCLPAAADEEEKMLIPVDFSVYGTGCLDDEEADAEREKQYLSEFLELSAEEIEAELGNRFRLAGPASIELFIDKFQMSELRAEAQTAKVQDGTGGFRHAFIAALLDKLHLKGVYDLIDPRYEFVGGLPAYIDDRQFLSELSKYDVTEIVLSFNAWNGREDYRTTDDQRKVLKMSANERTMRALYVILKYGDKQYYCDAGQLELCVLQTEGDVDCNGQIAIADAVLLARYLAEDAVTVTAQGLLNAELDGNPESLDAGDFAKLLQIIAGGDAD